MLCDHMLEMEECPKCCQSCFGTGRIECGCPAGDGTYEPEPGGCYLCNDQGIRRCSDCMGTGRK